MKITTITLQNVRQFIDPVAISGIGGGLNVLTAANEAGKSTFFDALHAAFFASHRSFDKVVQGLVPNAGGSPSVMVDFESAGDVWRLEKSWGRKASEKAARLYRNGTLVAQAGEAEDQLAGVIGAQAQGGPAGLLWVRQGVVDMSEGGAEQVARRGIMDSVAGEVEAMTGGRRMEAALAAVRKALDAEITSRGPKKDSTYKARIDEVATLEEAQAALETSVRAQEDDLARRRKARAELAEISAPEIRQADEKAAATAAQALAVARAHADKIRTAAGTVDTLKARHDNAADRIDRLDRALGEASAARAALDAATTQVTQDRAEYEVADQRHETALAADTCAAKAASAASAALQQVLRAQGAEAARAERAALEKRLKLADETRYHIEALDAQIAQLLSADALRRLDALAGDVSVATRARDAAAASLTIHYAKGAEARITRGGQVVPPDTPHPLPDRAIFDIEGVGQLVFRPGEGGSADSLARAEAALSKALAETGHAELASARADATGRVTLEAQRRDLLADLKALAPDGLEALRATLARLPEPAGPDPDLPDLVTAEAEEVTAREARNGAKIALEAARQALSKARDALSRSEAALTAAQGRHTRAQAELSAFSDAAAALDEMRSLAQTLQAELAGATAELDALRREAPDLRAAEAADKRARSVIDTTRERSQALEIELARLDTAIGQRGSEGIEEELALTTERLLSARAALAAIEFDIKVNQRLLSALETARAGARDRHVAPVVKELVPLLRLIWPDASPVVDAETGMITRLTRREIEEEVDMLSGGTREQLSLLVRLAFARILAREGRAAPVILDDAIVYTDDDRIMQMFDALTLQAEDVQVIVLSCRQRAFRELGGTLLTISPAAG
ncbi:AAA family ATPase [Shimia aestuarii]|uniref:DNA repair exonuclease SbcCD ATPase subunit n=1 Tax=Shimia aestuarii TaxID=254406 RepID=A0A1I4RNU5_9RHOB|nr:AAA family ATPase [Shimia aestuarii]SFM53826.1 DNA repair exonuclease SbcCD ATPase subunit [Shimia aestuarii]